MKNFRLAFRALLHFKGAVMINIVGLALGFACVIIIARYVYGEFSVDRFNGNIDRIYVTQAHFPEDNDVRLAGMSLSRRNGSPYILEFRQDPAIERISEFIYNKRDDISAEGKTVDAKTLATDSNFLRILDFPLLAGTPDLKQKNDAILTRTMAQKLFGEEDVLGKTFEYSGRTLTITGILGEPTWKSTLDFDVILPITLMKSWTNVPQSLVLLQKKQDYQEFNQRYDLTIHPDRFDSEFYFQLFPLKKVYFEQDIPDSGDFRHGEKRFPLLMILIGVLILVIGVVNFVNIYSAIILRRGREIGLKKVFGANGSDLFGQLFCENGLMIALALILGLALTELFHPLVKNGLGFGQSPIGSFVLLFALALLLVVPLITTVIPYLQYTHSAPVNALREIGTFRKKDIMRRIFLVFQYVLSLVLIVVSVFFLKQLGEMNRTDMGYPTGNIIRTSFFKHFSNLDGDWMERQESEMQKIGTVDQRIAASPLFLRYARARAPYEMSELMELETRDGNKRQINLFSVHESWFDVFGLELVTGRAFNREEDEDSWNVLVSESFLKAYGITDLTEPVELGPSGSEEVIPFRIVGVVRDFYTGRLSKTQYPIMIRYRGSIYKYGDYFLSVAPGRQQEAIAFLKDLHAEQGSGEFAYVFLSDEVQDLYREDRRITTLYSIFTGIAILISTLGLFSMSLYDIRQRRKEIAIRKVNGATTEGIIRLLLRRYMILLGLAFLIAVPVAMLAIQRYLQGFAYKAAVSWWIFALALLVTAGISLLTLIWQTAKAANANPADVIRSE